MPIFQLTIEGPVGMPNRIHSAEILADDADAAIAVSADIVRQTFLDEWTEKSELSWDEWCRHVEMCLPSLHKVLKVEKLS